MYLSNDKSLQSYRRSLRQTMTPAEAILWSFRRRRKLGPRFHRQYSIGTYILDFYCPHFRVAVELDGEEHNQPERMMSDEFRTDFLSQHGIHVLRFRNAEVFHNLNGVLAEIRLHLQP